MAKISFINNAASGGGETSATPLFCVNSGNVNSSGEGDLIGTATYDTEQGTDYNFTLTALKSGGVDTSISYTEGADGTLANVKATISTSTSFVSPSSNRWKVVAKVNFPTGNATKGAIGIYDAVDTYYQGITGGTGFVFKYQYKFEARFHLNGSAVTQFFDVNLQSFLSCEFTGEDYILKTSEDGENWTTLYTYNSSTVTTFTDSNHSIVTVNDNGSIYLPEVYYTINDEVVWTSFKTVQTIKSLDFKVGNTYSGVTATNGQGKTFEIEEFDTLDLSEAADGTYNLFVNEDGETYALANTIYIQNATPTMSSGDIWLDTAKYPYEVSKSGTTGHFEDIPFGGITIETQANGSKLITASETFRYNRLNVIATDLSAVAYSGSYNDLSDKPASAFPSNNYDAITILEPLQEFTAPADGFLRFSATSGGSSSYITLETSDNFPLYFVAAGYPSGYQMSLFTPISKGQKTKFGYGSVSNQAASFIYPKE